MESVRLVIIALLVQSLHWVVLRDPTKMKLVKLIASRVLLVIIVFLIPHLT